jgi:hypothetical protein
LKQHAPYHYFISKLGDLVAFANLLFKGKNMDQPQLYEKVGYMVYGSTYIKKHNYIPTREKYIAKITKETTNYLSPIKYAHHQKKL